MTQSGRDRGRPPTPRAATQMSSISGSSCGLSPACPGVSRTESGRPRRSTLRWSWCSTRLGTGPAHDRPAQAAGSCDSTQPPVRLLGAPAACWCALATVESTETTHSSSATACAWPCSSPSTRSQVPSLAHRSNRHQTVCQEGKSFGRSRHGDPVRNRQQIASTTRPVLTPPPTTTRRPVR